MEAVRMGEGCPTGKRSGAQRNNVDKAISWYDGDEKEIALQGYRCHAAYCGHIHFGL
jgi:hypothetical protein